jgi:hypothetical protein
MEEVLGQVKGEENRIMMVEWNAVVGGGKEGSRVGNFGLGERNAEGERIVEFFNEKKLVMTNTLIGQHQ